MAQDGRHARVRVHGRPIWACACENSELILKCGGQGGTPAEERHILIKEGGMARNQDTKIALTHPLLKGETMILNEKKQVILSTLDIVAYMIRAEIRMRKGKTHPDNYHDMLVQVMTLYDVLNEINRLQSECMEKEEE